MWQISCEKTIGKSGGGEICLFKEKRGYIGKAVMK